MKFDVNKVITESLLEITKETEVINEVGNANLEQVESGAREVGEKVLAGGKKVGEKVLAGGKKVVEDIKSGKLGEMAYDKLHPEKPDVAFEMAKRAVKVRAAAAEAAKVAKAEHDASVHGHLESSVKKIKTDAEEGITNLGHKVASRLGNLDYGNTALAGGAAIAAGLGALALRKRLKKVK